MNVCCASSQLTTLGTASAGPSSRSRRVTATVTSATRSGLSSACERPRSYADPRSSWIWPAGAGMSAMPALSSSLSRDHGALARRLGARSAERGEQLGFLRLRGLEVPILDVAVTANVLGNLRKLHGKPVIVRRERCDELIDERLVLPGQRALRPPLGGATEHVERRAAE